MKTTKKNDTVFLVLSSWYDDGNSEGSPDAIPFSDIETAKKYLKILVSHDRENGIHSSHDPDDEDDDWEITSDDDFFHAWSESANAWVRYEVVERTIWGKLPPKEPKV